MRLRVALLVLTVVAAWAPSARAAGVTATVNPAAVDLASGEHAVVHLLVENGTQGPIERLHLVELKAGSTGIAVTPRDPAPRSLAAGEATRFIVAVSAEDMVLRERSITLLVRYRQNRRPGRVGVGLKVTPEPAVDPTKIAALSVDGAFGDMRAGDTTRAYIRVTNVTHETLKAGPVKVTDPGYVTQPDSEAVELAPDGSVDLDVDLHVVDDVRPGKYPLRFDVPVTSASGTPITMLTAAKEEDVSIEGESELLKAFGVPTLLLLPGALLLGLAALLWNWQVLRHPADRPAPHVDIASVAFIGASVIASFLIISLWGLHWTDFFDSYSRKDIFVLAGVSAAAGVVGYLVGMGLRHGYQAWRTPKATDSPVRVLKKLGRQDLPVAVPRYQQDGANAYLIQPLRSGRPQTWFASRILLAWQEGSGTLQQDVNAARNGNDAKRLADLLAGGSSGGLVVVSWTGDGPYTVGQDSLGTRTGSEAIVYWE